MNKIVNICGGFCRETAPEASFASFHEKYVGICGKGHAVFE